MSKVKNGGLDQYGKGKRVMSISVSHTISELLRGIGKITKLLLLAGGPLFNSPCWGWTSKLSTAKFCLQKLETAHCCMVQYILQYT